MVGHDLNAALLFVRVVEAGSFRAAAKSIGVPKSTLSRKVAELEQRLGARLLQRTTRRLGLTEVGRGYFAQASGAVAQLLEAERSVAGQLAEPRGELRLTASTSVGTLLLPPVLTAFMQAHPQVRVTVELTERLVDLVQEGFDLAIRAGPLADSSLVAQRLADVDMHVYASPDYLHRRGTPQKPAELADHDCLLFAALGNRWQFGTGRTPPVKVTGRLTTNNLTLLHAAAEAGLGLARIPTLIAGASESQGSLVRVLDRFAPRASPLHAVYPSARFVSPSVRAFVALLRDRLPAAGHTRGTTRRGR